MAEDDPHEKFVRWQSITREQLSHANNLVLGLAGAALGFEISLSLNDKLALDTCWQRWALVFSLASLAASILFALATEMTRLTDFRLTTRTVKLRWKGNLQEADRLSECTDKLGDTTWALFKAQIASFSLGIVMVGAAIGPLIISKIF